MIKYISDRLLLNSSFINNSGLFHGKMGIAIVLFHLSRSVHKELYAKYADELLDQTLESLKETSSVGLENGLSGVAWGINHLVENEFILADVDDVLFEIDEVIKINLEKAVEGHDFGFLKGALGLCYYLLQRVENLSLKEEGNCKKYHDNLVVVSDVLHRRGIASDSVKENGDIAHCSDIDLFELVGCLMFSLKALRYEELRIEAQCVMNDMLSRMNSLFERESPFYELMHLFIIDFAHHFDVLSFLPELELLNVDNKSQPIIDRELLKREIIRLPPDKKFSTYRIFVGLLYQYLYKLTNNFSYLREAVYWKHYCNTIHQKEFDSILFTYPSKTKQLGVLNGISGLLLMNIV